METNNVKQRNLKDNGGLLDEVIFAVNTEKVDDLAYLEELVASNPRYTKHVATKEYDWYIGAWEAVQDPNALYVKVDDDVVSGKSPRIRPFLRPILSVVLKSKLARKQVAWKQAN